MSAATFRLGGGWGDRIQVSDWKTQSVVGWKDPMPEDGDQLLIPMKSGKVLVTVLKDVEPCRDPYDMFFARFVPVGYEGEPPFPKPVRVPWWRRLWRRSQ